MVFLVSYIVRRFYNYFPPFQPARMRNWEMQVQFKVTGSTKDLFGDGFALWYARDRMVPGPVFGSKDHFSGLAIIADTYTNNNGPNNVRSRLNYENRKRVLYLPTQETT